VKLFYIFALTVVVHFSAAAGGLGGNDAKIQMERQTFATEAYKEAALRVLLAEVNELAHDLSLEETTPLKKEDLTEVRIQPPFFTQYGHNFGCISSRNYSYCASKDNKLCYVTKLFQGGNADRLRDVQVLKRNFVLPKSGMDTNAAHVAALHFLEKAHVDVSSLEKHCSIEISALDMGSNFVPLYQIRWFEPFESLEMRTPDVPTNQIAAFVEFFAPTMQLRSLRISDAKYLMRRQLSVPNCEGLLQQTQDEGIKKRWYISPSYKEAAIKKMLQAINQQYSNLNLAESFPIKNSDITEAIIEPPFFSGHLGRFAVIYTSNYVYSAEAGNKLSYVNRNFKSGDESRFLHSLRQRYENAAVQVDTNSAYKLAKHFAEKAGVNLDSLERNSQVRVEVWNDGLNSLPYYQVNWFDGKEDAAVSVRVTTSDNSLQKLWVTDSQYINSTELVVTNR
jgi:hypothetical protein